MSDLNQLIAQIQQEVQREAIPIDEPIYLEAGKEPTLPILYAGNLNSKLCFFARDLGKDEIHANQPLYGAAGVLVRRGIYRAVHHQEPTPSTDLQVILENVVLTNTVPYKPPGNKAYSEAVKKRLRPFMEKFLLWHWQGDKIMTLGNEAFNWFAPYAPKGELKKFFERSDRYSASTEITLQATDDGGKVARRSVTLLPLPHPSPLNQQYYAQFPKLLEERLATIFS
jgi:uracil-DNA glycosylase